MAALDLNEYMVAARWSEIPDEYLSGALEETIDLDRFPGVILPAWVNGGICWYAIASDQREWRSLQPILSAYVGHTATTFNGEPTDLDADLEVEGYLASLDAHAIARLEPSKDILLGVRALERMKATLLARPTDLRPPQMSTAQIISHFDMCLVEGDREGAFHWLSRLKDELRLDALNMIFTRVKLHANFRNWKAILSDESFSFQDLCRVSKPAIIAHHLLEALWFVHMQEHPTGSENRATAYANHCKQFVEDIVAISGIPSTWARETYHEFLEDRISDATPPTTEATTQDESDKTVSLDAGNGDQRDDRRQGGWLVWIGSLDQREFKFTETAEELALNEDIGTISDPEDVRELEEALFELETRRELDRLEQALPHLIKWLKQDSGYPRKLMAPLYSVVLLRLIETHSREGVFREGIAEVITALLEVGLSADQYKGLLQDIADAIPEGAGTSDVFWLLDIADVLCRFSAAHESSRNTVLNRVLGSLQPVVHQMSSMQESAYINVATAAGWDIPAEKESKEQKSIAEALKGKVVGIYTLTESAGRQAKAALKRLAPGVRVEVSSEKVSTQRLAKLSQNADFLVVTTSSAKHAATDCIRAHRAAERILYAAGRGCGSILRALEDNLAVAEP
jgi:hypothetical protein